MITIESDCYLMSSTFHIASSFAQILGIESYIVLFRQLICSHFFTIQLSISHNLVVFDLKFLCCFLFVQFKLNLCLFFSLFKPTFVSIFSCHSLKLSFALQVILNCLF